MAALNVWGRHIDPATGAPVGDVFQVTSYQNGRFGLSPELGQMEIAVTHNRLFLPMVERNGAIWFSRASSVERGPVSLLAPTWVQADLAHSVHRSDELTKNWRLTATAVPAWVGRAGRGTFGDTVRRPCTFAIR